MLGFYSFIWFRWAMRVLLESSVFAVVFSLLITCIIYFQKGFPHVDTTVYEALEDIFLFWVAIVWNVSLLLALFRSLKYIFNFCKNGYMYRLLDCKTQEYIDPVGYGDLVPIWRRWFLSLIWISAAEIVIATAIMRVFFGYTSVFAWMGTFELLIFVLIAGYFSFVLLGSKAQKVKVVRC
jgi:hypothetical protein